jgi:hypothetical protein
MGRIAIAAVTTAVALLGASAASAVPIFFAGTGNYYERIDGSFTAQEARGDAATKTFLGVTGHLVTITSASENDHVDSLGGSGAYWIGASDAATEGTWQWDVGPEAGQTFWQADLPIPAPGGIPPPMPGTAVGYENWDSLSPNNFLHTPAGEDFAGMSLASGEWGDSPNDPGGFDGYIVEFSVPEPSTLGLLGVGSLALRARARRRRAGGRPSPGAAA